MGLRSGTLNRRIALVRMVTTVDGYGDPVGTLHRLGWRLASVKPARRREVFEAGGVEARAELTAWLRFDALTRAVTERDQVIYQGRLYEITAAPIEVGRGAGIELLLVAADGGVLIDPDGLPAA